MSVSGNLSIVVNDVKPLVLYDVECEMAMDSMKGKCASSWFDLGYTNLFCILEVTSVFFYCCDSVLGDSLHFHQGNRGSSHLWLEHWTPQHEMQGNQALSCSEGEVSWVFSSCGRHLVYILELQRVWPFETWVCLATSGHLSSYDGHLGKIYYAWQENTDTSGGEPGGQASINSSHSYIGIPINFHEESGIVTFWSIELSAPLEVSNGCEVLCPEEVENYGFL